MSDASHFLVEENVLPTLPLQAQPYATSSGQPAPFISDATIVIRCGDAASHAGWQPTSPCELAARIYAILMLVHAVTALVLHSTTNPSRIRMGLPPVDPMQLDVVNNEDEVATVVCNRLESAAKAAIAERGHFALAIPGGSVMKMLEGTSPSWADQCTLAYVNHKAVPMDDEALSTHAKASSLFLEKGWSGANVITLTGSADPAAEAASYAQQLQSLPEMTLPREDGTPVFDLILIGVGDDGHVRHNLGLTHANIACA